MQKTVYYSQKYMNRKTGLSTGPEVAVSRVAKHRQSKVSFFMIAACLAVAVLMVLLVPILVGGAPPSTSQVEAAINTQNIATFNSPREAREFLAIQTGLPTALPEGYGVAGSRVVDGKIIEIDITNGKANLVFRTAQGNEDLSGTDYDEYSYTATETVNDVARGYAGVSDKKLNMAVWADGEFTYAIVADNAIPAEQMKLIAESVA
ncbi:MAG: hypothetical protein AB7V55_03655 [Oscillospiraceae bacterium]